MENSKFVEQYCASVGHNVVMEIVSKEQRENIMRCTNEDRCSSCTHSMLKNKNAIDSKAKKL